jgi:hypothetical protein
MTEILGQVPLDSVDHDLAHYLFLRARTLRGHDHIVRRELKRAIPLSALPSRARNLQTVDLVNGSHVVADVDDTVVHVHSWKTSAWVTASATDPAEALAIVEEIRGSVPVTHTVGKVDVTFSDSGTGSRYLELDTRPWTSVRDNYNDQVRRVLDEIVQHTPDASEPRRLLLWHGRPGTGKTTAIRALLDAWREWADGVIVTDPEQLLNDGRYLRRLVLDESDDDRWQLLVLEDAEALLHKGTAGRGMATLLNLCDGLLGQGLRCLFLITTNEPLAAVHPALVRAGRCLSQVEFGPLAAEQASALLGRPVAVPMTLAEVMAAKPVTSLLEPTHVGQYL